MSVALAQREGKALASLASDIRAEHEACERDAQSAVEHATHAGELLIEAKTKVKHGGWLPWLSKNFEFTRQTAADYMRIADKCREVPTFDPPSVKAALAELTEPRSSFADDDEAEEVDGEIVEEPPKSKRRSDPPEGAAHFFPDVVADDALDNLRTQALHWFEQGLLVKGLLDKKRPLEPRDKEDRKAIKREAAVMERVAQRIQREVANA